MNSKENSVLERLAALSLERCLVKLSKVSAGTWELLDTAAARGTLLDAVGLYDFRGGPAAAIYVDVAGEVSLATLVLFDPEGMDCISKCFLGYSFPRSRSVSQSEEVMLLELGNILLNSLCNSIMNALRASFIPSVPRFCSGGRSAIAEALGPGIPSGSDPRIVAVTLGMRSGASESRCKVLLLVPGALAQALEQAAA
ncbi:MAG TPA: hypothetical protein PKI19_11485 [Elusimicrobiales bacterium]|nr:hypothetical protein [Elusimicrobiales bacterium]